MVAEWCYLVQPDGLIFDGCQYDSAYESRGWTVVPVDEAAALAVNAARHHPDNGALRWRWDGSQAVEVPDTRPIVTLAITGTTAINGLPAVSIGGALRLQGVARDAAGNPVDMTGMQYVCVMSSGQSWTVGAEFVGDAADCAVPVSHPGRHRIEPLDSAAIRLAGDVEFEAYMAAPAYVSS